MAELAIGAAWIAFTFGAWFNLAYDAHVSILGWVWGLSGAVGCAVAVPCADDPDVVLSHVHTSVVVSEYLGCTNSDLYGVRKTVLISP